MDWHAATQRAHKIHTEFLTWITKQQQRLQTGLHEAETAYPGLDRALQQDLQELRRLRLQKTRSVLSLIHYEQCKQ